MSEPRTALREHLADPDRRPVLVALDFDGTLAPLGDDPRASRMLPAAAAALCDLVNHPDLVRVALVSGRALASLLAVADPPVGTVLIGSHGGERARVTPDGPQQDAVHLTEDQTDRLAALRDALEEVAAAHEGVWVEAKPSAMVLHTRPAGPTDSRLAEEQALAVGRLLGSKVLHGKDVVEVSVLEVDKGSALVALRDALGAGAVLYAGDDVTDEYAFDALGPQDVTVKVGDGPTAARFRVADPQQATDLLVGVAADVAALDRRAG